MNKEDVNRILKQAITPKQVKMRIGSYDYLEDVKAWEKEHGKASYLNPPQLPRWMV